MSLYVYAIRKQQVLETRRDDVHTVSTGNLKPETLNPETSEKVIGDY